MSSTRFWRKKLSAKEAISSTEGSASRSGLKASRSQATAKMMTMRMIAATTAAGCQAPMKSCGATAADGTIRA